MPGLVVAALGAVLGWIVNQWSSSISSHVIAVVVGIALANTGALGLRDGVLRPGLRMAARRVLRIGIVLVGMRLSLGELADIGPRALLSVVLVVVVTFVGVQWLGRQLGLSSGLSTLVATGYSICGASAIAAAEPFADARDEEVAYAVGLVTLCGSLAIFVLPPVGNLLGLTPADFGSWVGASVHDVGQVVATASVEGADALTVAVVVKLTRVILLAPLLVLLAVSARRARLRADTGSDASSTARPPLVPLFIALFLVAVAVRSTGAVPDGWLDDIKTADTLLLGAGLVGLGANVDLRRLRALGGRPLVLGLTSWVLVATVAYAAVLTIG